VATLIVLVHIWQLRTDCRIGSNGRFPWGKGESISPGARGLGAGYPQTSFPYPFNRNYSITKPAES
jgi:hypothetical protein